MDGRLKDKRAVVTDVGQGLLDTYGESLVQSIPLGRMGTPEDVGRLAVFLCCDDASWITGKNVRIDGGLW